MQQKLHKIAKFSWIKALFVGGRVFFGLYKLMKEYKFGFWLVLGFRFFKNGFFTGLKGRTMEKVIK